MGLATPRRAKEVLRSPERDILRGLLKLRLREDAGEVLRGGSRGYCWVALWSAEITKEELVLVSFQC